MNIKEVFCNECYSWKKQEDLELYCVYGELYCKECGAILIRTDEYKQDKEKLYTVEIPDPNGSGKHVLVKGIEGDVFIGHKCPNNWREVSYYQLTESEIKEDFGWAWQFAKEVEE